MGQGPWEAHQDGDELRAGVESLTSGPAGQVRAAGPHQYWWEEGREGSFVHCCAEKGTWQEQRAKKSGLWEGTGVSPPHAWL